MDWSLPDMAGKELLETLHTLSDSSAHIIVFTAYDTDQLGISSDLVVIIKPLITKDFIKAINKVTKCKTHPKNVTEKTALNVDENMQLNSAKEIDITKAKLRILLRRITRLMPLF
jgi:DNA-binding response OmpR family regulator